MRRLRVLVICSICLVTRSRSALGSCFFSSFMRLLYHWFHALIGRPLTNRATLYLMVVEACPLLKEGLTYLIVSSIVEVLGLEGSGINHGIAWVLAVDDVLFDQLHDTILLSHYILLYTCCKRQALRLREGHPLLSPGTYPC